ncbi:DNA mismatch repair protein MutT, partial [Listeria monocytogenes]|nr:DNA mismatch repair protein MutT [Listeria monocytogenes]
WILNPENTGVVNNLPYIIEHAPVFPARIEVSTKYQENTLLHISHQSL